MTRATVFSGATSDFDDFLYAPIREDRGGLPLSVVSALARLDAAGRVFFSERALACLEATRSPLLHGRDANAVPFDELTTVGHLAFWFACIVDEIPLAFDLNSAAAVAPLSILALSHAERSIVKSS